MNILGVVKASAVFVFPVRLALAGLFLFALFTTSNVHASPIFGVGDCNGCMSWQDALDAQLVQPANDPTNPELEFYSGQANEFSFSVPELFVANVTDQNSESHESLVMAWEQGAGELTVSAWEYVYDQDPDLTGTRILFSLFFPPGMWDFSIELIDARNLVRGWFVDIATAGPGGTPLAANTWYQLSLDPSKLIPQGFIPGPIQDPGFNLAQVVKIRLDEAGNNLATFPAPPPGGSIIGQWNAWNSLQVVPEPASLALMGLGLLGIFSVRARSKA